MNAPVPSESAAPSPAPLWKRVALSYWTPVGVGTALLVAHAIWFARCAAASHPEPIGGYGAWMIVLGLLVAARPFIHAGVRSTARQSVLEPYLGPFAMPSGATKKAQDEHARRVEAAVPGVIAERVVAVLVIGAGTLVNGYSGPIARGLAWTFGLEDRP